VPSYWYPKIDGPTLTVRAAVAPKFGVLYYEICEGSVTSFILCTFIETVMEEAKKKTDFFRRDMAGGTRFPLLFDNARMHRSK